MRREPASLPRPSQQQPTAAGAVGSLSTSRHLLHELFHRLPGNRVGEELSFHRGAELFRIPHRMPQGADATHRLPSAEEANPAISGTEDLSVDVLRAFAREP